MARLYFTVTNDLNFDQRMNRICTSLAEAGHRVTLVGRLKKNSRPLQPQPYRQVRLFTFFERGFLFYAIYNIHLFFYLMTRKMDAICAIDLDTILPCYLTSKFRRKKRIYDAHELFCEMKEISSRPRVYKIWKAIEKRTVPHFKLGYCVNHFIAERFKEMYQVDYTVIRNMPWYKPRKQETNGDFILYQGAVNEGRCFETLIPAMQWIDTPLWIAGDGNFMAQARALASQYGVEHKIHFKGMLPPDELRQLTQKAKVGFTLFEPDAESNYYSLANRFFDYMHAGVPQVCVDYPAYREIYTRYEIGILIPDVSSERIAEAVNNILHNPAAATRMQEACKKAAAEYNWQHESETLKSFYQQHLG